MINHAIIGCGRIAENHADAFSLLPNVHIKYAVDVVEERAKDIAGKFPIGQISTDFTSILQDPDLHSVSLTLPHHLHGSLAMEAVKAGKHVLIEKPLVIDPEEGKELIKMAAQAGVVVLPVAQHRFDNIVREIKSLIDSGDMGSIRFLRAHLECTRPAAYYTESDWRGKKDKEGGSVLINQAYHLLDLMLYFAGQVSSVSGAMHTFQDGVMETEDTLCATLRFQNNAIGSLSICGSGGSSWSSYIELICEKGLVAFDINFPNQLHRFEMQSKGSMKKWRDRLREALPKPGDQTSGTWYYGTSHREQAADFISEITKEKATEGATLEQALHVVSTIQQIYDSAKK
ncbi:Gfo/Idh/MocA family protein [Chitinophagaceae bacterium MMS25-I14]